MAIAGGLELPRSSDPGDGMVAGPTLHEIVEEPLVIEVPNSRRPGTYRPEDFGWTGIDHLEPYTSMEIVTVLVQAGAAIWVSMPDRFSRRATLARGDAA